MEIPRQARDIFAFLYDLAFCREVFVGKNTKALPRVRERALTKGDDHSSR